MCVLTKIHVIYIQLKDAGGFEALVTGKTTSMQRIDVNERITSLERLNPSPRPTTYVLPLFNFLSCYQLCFNVREMVVLFLQVSLLRR